MVLGLVGFALWPAGPDRDSQLVELKRRLAIGATVDEFPEIEELASDCWEAAEIEAYVYDDSPLGYRREKFENCLVYSFTFDDHSQEGLVGFDVVVLDGRIVAWREDVLIL